MALLIALITIMVAVGNSQIRVGDPTEHLPERSRLLTTDGFLEPILCFPPQLLGSCESAAPRRRQRYLAAPPVVLAYLDANVSSRLERTEVVAERRPIHDHRVGERIDCDRPQSVDLAQ